MLGAIAIDGREILKMSYLGWQVEGYYCDLESVLPRPERDKLLMANSIFSSDHLYPALRSLINEPIDNILRSEDVLVRALGMLDGRLGKRRLKEISVDDEPEIVRRLWLFRCYVEGLYRFASPEEARLELCAEIPTRIFSRAHKAANKPDAGLPVLKLQNSKVSSNLERLLKLLESGELLPEQITSASAQAIVRAYKQRPAEEQGAFLDTVYFLLAKTDLFETTPNVQAAISIAASCRHFLRPLQNWKRPAYNADKQLGALLRHLFVLYDMPIFMDSAWTSGHALHQQWYLHLGQGKNIRTADGLPLRLTKRMAHEFLRAPDYYSIAAALRWAQVRALGGDLYLSDALLDSRLVDNFDNDQFWFSVLQFLVANPLIDCHQITPIIDFIYHQKFAERFVFTEAGLAERVGPPAPDFSMKGRSAANLLELVDAWHVELGQDRANKSARWKKSAVRDFEFVMGAAESRNMKIYRLRELLSGAELQAEGQRLRHCVGSYTSSCVSGRSTIWSMTVDDGQVVAPLLTVELRMADLRSRHVG